MKKPRNETSGPASHRPLTASGRSSTSSARDPGRRGPGRPRVTLEELEARTLDYCRRYGVAANAEGLPPFPSGRRETPQHREWMALYKAHRRLAAALGALEPDSGHGAAEADRARLPDLLAAQQARCPICRGRVALGDARVDDGGREPAALHARCFDLVALARALGPEALDRAKRRID
jgi:hypothetical protein